jgi:hypothetical protein
VRRPEVWLCAAVAAFVAALGVIGADALWLVPVGERVAHGHLPSSIPYATAPTSGWHDVPAGGELVFWAAYRALGGERGLVILQAAAAALAVGTLARALGRQSAPGAALVIALLVTAGALSAVGVTNVSLFSLALFAVLLALVERDDVARSSRVWLAVPLIAVWGNLHGAVLIGWALLLCYLVLARARGHLAEAAAILAAATAALFANPELWHTPSYYWSVFHNVAAKRGIGLWTPLSSSTLDLLLIAVFVVLAGLALRRVRAIRPWEAVAAAGLAAASVHVARNGVWLLFVLAFPAARSLSFAGPRPRLVAVAAGAVAIGVVAALARKPPDPGAWAIARAAARTGQTVVAEPVLGQQVAVEGGRVWVDNPLDAFRAADQELYVDWYSGKPTGSAAIDHGRVVLVRTGSEAGRRAARDRRLVLLTAGYGAALYRVRG